jgi:hypothetical protein
MNLNTFSKIHHYLCKLKEKDAITQEEKIAICNFILQNHFLW